MDHPEVCFRSRSPCQQTLPTIWARNATLLLLAHRSLFVSVVAHFASTLCRWVNSLECVFVCLCVCARVRACVLCVLAAGTSACGSLTACSCARTENQVSCALLFYAISVGEQGLTQRVLLPDNFFEVSVPSTPPPFLALTETAVMLN